ncbi:hypothetical protein C8R43DRAFT_1174393 [Mycena crocata]|nr:hypothetical protein C8R43DRAFT_1174393 [Mycena crocata]
MNSNLSISQDTLSVSVPTTTSVPVNTTATKNNTAWMTSTVIPALETSTEAPQNKLNMVEECPHCPAQPCRVVDSQGSFITGFAFALILCLLLSCCRGPDRDLRSITKPVVCDVQIFPIVTTKLKRNGQGRTGEPPIQWIPRPGSTTLIRTEPLKAETQHGRLQPLMPPIPTPSSSTNPKGSDPFQSPPDSYTLLEFLRASFTCCSCRRRRYRSSTSKMRQDEILEALV